VNRHTLCGTIISLILIVVIEVVGRDNCGYLFNSPHGGGGAVRMDEWLSFRKRNVDDDRSELIWKVKYCLKDVCGVETDVGYLLVGKK
jgi:hypothetical protein